MSCSGGTCSSTAFQPGWPVKIGIIDEGLLPDVGEGINGSPVVAPLRCPSGGAELKIGVTPDAGPAYIFNSDGTSCYGKDDGGHDNSLETEFSQGNGQYDHPAFAAVGYPAFGTLDGKTTSFFAPVTSAFPPQQLQPGSSLAIGLASGDITAGAVGTVTYVDGDKVWGFGHPFDATGRRELLLKDAYVYTVIGNPVGIGDAISQKLAAPGHDLGTITADGPSGIGGRLGPLPPLIPIRRTR